MPVADRSANDEAAPPVSPVSTAPAKLDLRVEPGDLLIRPRKGWIAVDWRELFVNRELLYFLIWRDVKVRYKQTVLGVAWAVLQPLMMMAIFSVIFGRVVKIPSEGLPYAVFVFAGLIPWTFFSSGLAQGANSLVTQNYILSKIYLPRLYIPTAGVGLFLIDMAVSFGLYALILAWYGITPGWGLLALPFLVALVILLTLGLSFGLSALIVLYRDFRILVPFLIQILMYTSPVIYPASMLPRRLQTVLLFNPLVGIIEGFRSAMLGTPWNLSALAGATAVTLGVFFLGLHYFRRIERLFADVA